MAPGKLYDWFHDGDVSMKNLNKQMEHIYKFTTELMIYLNLNKAELNFVHGIHIVYIQKNWDEVDFIVY